ncbi:MAG: hypothetical protein IAF94_19865, partial [Pirellulaceae bacterium]|nr:hypothetical protein [Pirellulaceae bacterium]
MKLDKLVKTLRRDLTANPLKAGVLGVLLLGGMYFWGPLIWKWVGKKGAAAPDMAVVPSSSPSSSSGSSGGGLPTSGAGESKETGPGWREVRDRRKADPLARSADFRPPWSQIFQVAATVTKAEEPEVEVQTKQPAEVDPRNLGLVLQGVAIGPQGKKAIISGKVYREQDSITVSRDSDATRNENGQRSDVVFTLLRVYRKMVVVEREGKVWELKLTSAAAQGQPPTEFSPVQPDKDEPRDEKAFQPDKL